LLDLDEQQDVVSSKTQCTDTDHFESCEAQLDKQISFLENKNLMLKKKIEHKQ